MHKLAIHFLLAGSLAFSAFGAPTDASDAPSESRLPSWKFACSALVAAVTVGTTVWALGSTWNRATSAEQRPEAEPESQPSSARFGRFLLNQELELLTSTYFGPGVATQIKSKIATEKPHATSLPRWNEKGLRIPLSEIQLTESDEDDDKADILLVGPLLTLRSEKPVNLSDLEQGKPVETEFVFSRKEESSQGLEIRFSLEIKPLAPELTPSITVRIRGTLHAYKGFFTHNEPFENIPWQAAREE